MLYVIGSKEQVNEECGGIMFWFKPTSNSYHRLLEIKSVKNNSRSIVKINNKHLVLIISDENVLL